MRDHRSLSPGCSQTLTLAATPIFWEAAWRRQTPGSQKRRLGGSQSIVAAAAPSRNWGSGEYGAAGRSSGLWPRPSVQGVCMWRETGVQQPARPLLFLPSSSRLPPAYPAPSSASLPPPRPRRPSPWALPLRITLPVPRQLCAFTGAARWGEGGREARDQELQEAGRTLRALSGQFNEIMKVKCFIPPGAHSGRLISLCLVPSPGVWRKQGSESGWGASEGT